MLYNPRLFRPSCSNPKLCSGIAPILASIGCAPTDYQCQCTAANLQTITNDAESCILSNCSSELSAINKRWRRSLRLCQRANQYLSSYKQGTLNLPHSQEITSLHLIRCSGIKPSCRAASRLLWLSTTINFGAKSNPVSNTP